MLGKGLSALLPNRTKSAEPGGGIPPAIGHGAPPGSGAQLPERFEDFHSVPLDQVKPGREQPRGNFDSDRLEDLSRSIALHGMIQPITVTKISDQEFRIVAGERRWRAAKLAGLTEIPVLVRSVRDNDLLELALIENIQREDLNPLEVAAAFQRLHQDHGLSHEQIAERTGKDRSTVTNTLRLLKLSPAAREALLNGSISMGHARAILNMDHADQSAICDQIKAKQLSVRATEAIAKRAGEVPATFGHVIDKKRFSQSADPNVRAAIEEMSMALGTRVKLYPKSGTSGRLEVEYYTREDLDRIYSVIVKGSAEAEA